MKDFGLRTIEDHSSISSSDGELELLMKFKKFMKQMLKNQSKKNVTTCYERKKKEALWDKTSTSKDEEQTDEDKVANFALMTLDNKVNNSNKYSLSYYEIT